MLKELNRFTEKHGFAIGAFLFIVLVGPLVFLFGQGGCENVSGDLLSGDKYGTLDGKPVTDEDFKHNMYAFALQQVLLYSQPIDLNAIFRSREEARNMMRVISRMRLLRFAEEMGWGKVTKSQLADYKKKLPIFMEEGKYSVKKYDNFKEFYLAKQPISLMEFNKICMENITLNRINAYLSSSTISNAELRAEILTGDGDVDYVLKTFDKSSFKGEPVTEKEIKEYYENFKGSKLKFPERMMAKLAVFPVEARAPGAKPITEEEIKAEFEKRHPDYEVKASHILVSYKGATRADEEIKRTKEEAEKRAKELYKKATAKDADFAKLAEENSDGPSKDDGGNLGFFPRKGAMAEAFAEAAYGLKTGEITEPVETPFGYHVIMVTDRRPLKIKETLENLRDRIRNDLVREKDKELWEKAAMAVYKRDKKTEYSKEQAKITFVRISKKRTGDKKEEALDRNQVETIHKEAVASKDLVKFAKELKEKSKTLDMFQSDSGFVNVTESTNPMIYVKEGLKLDKGTIGPLVEDDDAYYLIQKTDVRNEQPFEDVKMRIVYTERSRAQIEATQAATKTIKSMLDELKKLPSADGKAVDSFISVAKKYKATMVDTPLLSTQSDEFISSIMNGVKAQDLYGRIKDLTKESPYSRDLSIKRSYRFIACLTSKEAPREPTLDEARPMITKTLQDANALKQARATAKTLKDSLMAQLEKGTVPKVLDTFEKPVDYEGVRDRSRIPEQYDKAEGLSKSTGIRSVGYSDLESGALLVFVNGRDIREKTKLDEALTSRLERLAGTNGDSALYLGDILEDKYEFIPDPKYASLFDEAAK